MIPHLLEAGVNNRVIDLYSPSVTRVYNDGFSLTPEQIPHDVLNCAYKIQRNGEWLFYATDTSTLDHIEAKNYDLYLLEANHGEAEIAARIAEKQASGEFAYEIRAAQNHLSQEQAMEWLYRNAWLNSKYVFLHKHKNEKRRK